MITISNVNGEVVGRHFYDVFGEPNRVSDVNNPYMFTGRRYDFEAGLYYYRARYYAHDIGRFLQPDPIGYDDGLNMYAYCGNNPIRFVDPHGLKLVLFGSRADKKAFKKAAKYFSQTSLFSNTYDYLSSEDTPTVNVFIGTEYPANAHIPDHFDGLSAVLWNPILGLETLTGGRMSPTLGLAHELEHARIKLIGGIDEERNEDGIKPTEENYIVDWFEGLIARELGEDFRSSYYDVKGGYKTFGPTKTCKRPF